MNFLMFLDVRRSNSRNVALSSSQKKEMKLAVMLMIVVLVFLICNVLPFIVNIMELFSISYKPLTGSAEGGGGDHPSIQKQNYIIHYNRDEGGLVNEKEESDFFARLD